jgi:hypothetical protein
MALSATPVAATAVKVTQATAAQPVATPVTTATAGQVLAAVPVAVAVENEAPAPAPQDAPPLHITAPQPLMPPEGSKPSVHTSSQELPPAETEPAPVAVAVAVSSTPRVHAPSLFRRNP